MIQLASKLRYPLREVAAAIGAELISEAPDAIVEHVLLDSRQVIYPASSIFIALKGRQHDGHAYITKLYRQGVHHFLVSQVPSFGKSSPPADVSFLLVSDTMEAFQRLAAWHRSRFGLPVIGITGSNGKTIVKEWLFQLLNPEYHIVRSPRSYNSQTGVPLSVLQINSRHTLGIFEAGISQPEEMARLEVILRPGIGLFTNIGEAHGEGFADRPTKIREKLRLFFQSDWLLYCADHKEIHQLVQEQQTGLPARRLFTWSAKGNPADVHIQPRSSSTATGGQRLHVEMPVHALHFEVEIPFADDASIENASHCLALMLQLGYKPEVVAERLGRIEPIAMRLELKSAINGCSLINDSYNSDLTSLNIALNFLQQQSTHTRRTLLLSDILQSGMPAKELYRTVAGLVVEKNLNRFIGVGREVPAIREWLPAGIEQAYFTDTEALLAALPSFTFEKESILLKGARRFGFERVANRLAMQIHNTTLEVNLGALVHNLRVFQQRLSQGTRLMAMVKAGAYGSGSVEVAKLLEFQQVDYLGVAYADEGAELRKARVQLPIMVMNPEAATFDALLRYGLEPEIYSTGLLHRFVRFATDNQQLLTDPETAVAIHLKLDTGMHRLGFTEGDLPEVLRIMKGQSGARVLSVFSHLASSDEPADDDFTHAQVSVFQRMYSILKEGLGYSPLHHILNSSGILRFPQYQFDMVRLGVGLYGIDNSGSLPGELQVVNTLKATISQIKGVAPGETIGYGRMPVTGKPMRIATISVGYADGLLRKVGNGAFSVVIRGSRAPLVGNVCMDMAMVDVTHLPEAEEGDSVVIFGNEPRVEELAAVLGTIPYEIFTSISARVKRVFIQE